ncbi:LytTR family DNA-binding domain-containing protein [Pseudotenacibaculum sp. MALMAid0570]|uniref:LytR/AlgR family response regulator transcription factor n=1 Tax=Pseudotenacibaculum sp. MALMAid0570 TaxID=3143938 RepID=UPI0032DEC1D8
MLERVQKYYRIGAVILFVLIFIIAFQTYQQIFYIERFQLAKNVEFFDVLKNQFFRWIIWLLIAFLLPFFVAKDKEKSISFSLVTKHFLLIILLVILNVFVISFIQASNAVEVTLHSFFSDYVVFFLFQKSPMYTLGYIAFTVILFFYFKNETLQVTVQELIDIKENHQKEYQLLKNSNVDEDQVLSIKIGNKLKIIPISEINWIEADDYCVVVHAEDKPSYTMRSSLKSLENKLPTYFMRVHRKGIVNMRKVKELKNADNTSCLVISNDAEVPVSKANIKAVKLFLQHNS